MRRFMLSCLFLCLAMLSHTQDITAVKYKDAVFSDITVQKNSSYSSGTHPEKNRKYDLFDLYESKSDRTVKRPLIIWLHGGGFKFGSKNARGIRLWSELFAKRGYVCAALNYRLSKKNPLFNFNELKKSCYDAVQSVHEAIVFFKKNHELYRIDTNRIILAGNSAGGMIALQSAYSSPLELAALARVPGSEILSAVYNPDGIAAVINFWGGLFKAEWLERAHVPVFSACGNKDKIVPFDHKDTSLYGSLWIHEKATALHIPNDIKIYEGYSHELQKHFNPLFSPGAATRERWRDAGQMAAGFLYMQFFK